MEKRPPDNQNNIWMALLLSMGVFLAWQYFYAEPKMREERERQRVEKLAKNEANQNADKAAGTTAAPVPVPGAAEPAATNRTAIVRSSDRKSVV